MPDNTVNTVFTADATSAKAGANEAATAVKKSAEQQKEAVGGLGKFVKGAAAGFGFIAAIGWAKKLGEAIRNIGADAEASAARVQKASVDLGKSLKGIASPEPSQLQKDLDATVAATAAAIDTIVAERQALIDSLQIDTGDPFSFYTDAARVAVGQVTETNDAIRGQIDNATARIEQAKKQHVAAMEAIEQAHADKMAAIRLKAEQDRQLEEQRRINEAAAAQSAADDASLDRAKQYQDEAAKLRAGAIEDDAERAITEFQLGEQKRRHDLKMAQSQAEADAIRELHAAATVALEAQLTKIHKEGEKEREEDTKRSVARQIELYEALQGAIEGASQAQQSFTQNQFGGMVSDIKKIAQLLEVRGGWKK